jgi:hypothetical protein
MNKKILYLAIGLILIIVLILVIYLRKSPSKSEQVAPKSQIETISTESVQRPQLVADEVFYLGQDGSLNKVSLSDKSQGLVYKPTGKILDFYPAPDGSKVIVAEKNNDEIKNYLIQGGAKNTIDDCLTEAINWISPDEIIANCIKQEWEFDPNTVNNIQFSDPMTKKVTSSIDINFRFDQLKSIFSDGKDAIVLNKNNGYGTNDVYSLDLETKRFKNLTNNGYITDIKKNGNAYLTLSKDDENNPGMVGVVIGDNSFQELSSADSLDLFAFSKNQLISLDKENNLTFTKPDSPNEIGSQINPGKSLGKINYLISDDSRIIIFASAGIFTIII